MIHEEFTGVTFNDLDPSGTRISRLSVFFVVNSNRAKYTAQSAYFYPNVTLRSGFANPSVCSLSGCHLSVLNVLAAYSGAEHVSGAGAAEFPLTAQKPQTLFCYPRSPLRSPLRDLPLLLTRFFTRSAPAPLQCVSSSKLKTVDRFLPRDQL